MNWSLKSNYDSLAIIAFGLASFLLRFTALNQTHHPNGWDGYYYVMQSHSWLNFGFLQSVDYSLIYPYFIFISYLVGDYFIAFKIGTAALSGGVAIASYILLLRQAQNRWTAILLSSYLLFSPTMTYFISQFPKNALGLIFFLFTLKSVGLRQWKMIILFSILSFLTHRMMGGLCVLVLFALCIRHLNWKWFGLGLVSAAALSLLPGVLHLSDFQRFTGEIFLIPQFAPFSFYTLFENELSIFWITELVIITISIILISFIYIKRKKYQSSENIERVIWPVIILVTMFPFFQVQNGSMGYRFFLIAPILVVIFLLILLNPKKKMALPLSILLITGSLFSFRSYDPLKYDPPNKLYEIIVERINTEFSPEEYPLVISHKSLAEMIIYKTDFDALNWNPSTNIEGKSTLRIIHNLEYFHFSKYLAASELLEVQKLTLHYYITTEHIWNLLVSRINEAKDDDLMQLILNGSNPMVERPYYLKKGKNL